MSTRKAPRRPAMLDAEQAENIPGAEDAASSSEVAHLVAQTLLGIEKESDENVQRLRQLLESGGIDTVSELWSTSPASTLPGTLWRLYLVYQWYLRNPQLVNERFQQGLAALDIGDIFSREHSDKSVANLMDELAALWQAQTSIAELAPLLDRVSDFLQVLASGVSAEWIKDSRDELADSVTLRPQALLQTADDLKLSARAAKANHLN
ncbi:hypothetical protein [Varibaculum massiliense]|uniref:hypothetical protein n=1 Tax=Varibaculum massiliense TaxID=1852372 RepID=UPI0008DAA78C|nr:hypothetical protein [Varibaculum massiliense]